MTLSTWRWANDASVCGIPKTLFDCQPTRVFGVPQTPAWWVDTRTRVFDAGR